METAQSFVIIIGTLINLFEKQNQEDLAEEVSDDSDEIKEEEKSDKIQI